MGTIEPFGNSAELEDEIRNSFVSSMPSVFNPGRLAYFSYAHID